MKLFINIMTLLFAIGCSPKKSEKSTILSAQKYAQLKISVDENFSQDRTRIQYFESDSGEYLAILNKIGPAIEIISLSDKLSKARIPIFKDGPNRVGVDNGFFIAAKDSILLASIPPSVLILDFQGNVKKRTSINNPENVVNYLSSTNETPFLFNGSTLFGAQPFFKNIYQTTEPEVTRTKVIYKINLENNSTDTSEWLPVFRPKDVWKDGKKSLDFTWTDRGDSIIVSPHTDHRLWIISKKTGELLKYKEAISSHVKEFRIIKGYPVGDQGIIETLVTGQYDLLLHDSYRDIFYRFFYIGIDWESYGKSPRELYANRPKVGVLVLDHDLDIIGEHVFDDHSVENWNYFVGKKGLYVSTNNPNRDDFDENFLRYDIIRFEGLEYED
ncbi:uncharacterized protein DUF4221 [Algoriphagus ratkowskyi]|uniref:DUF4221 domain-containing protein n=1 Tax=Algoriphagus ratkowskyi TaxID=57028 RepID=A0A2W7SBB0_9BACT|nr:DUF4221 family protein [Algoriphagus ratkowskyi]PZX60145.1 uncharacterized protein DUF4221 [Algoriphagus ratkowskyi]TXD77972.1 DUF4221 domain-containing protein [Algoriphagus ratkowskyi]